MTMEKDLNPILIDDNDYTRIVGEDGNSVLVKNSILKDYCQDDSRANMYASADITATLEDVDTWYPMQSPLIIGQNLKDFTFLNGVYTYTGLTTKKFLFNGEASLSTKKSCKITFSLFINDIAVPGITDTLDVSAVDKKEPMGVTSIITLNTGDVVSVKAKTDTSDLEVTVTKMQTTLWR